MKRAFVVAAALALALGAASPSADAGTTPTSFSFQAVLRNSAGTLQSLQLDVFLNLWTAQVGGTELKTYGQVVTAENGVFSVTVTDAALPALLAANSSLWVEVSAVGYGTFPRQQVTSQLYAMQSATSESLGCSGCITMQHLSTGAAGSLSLPYGSQTLTGTLGGGAFSGNLEIPATPFVVPANGVCIVTVSALYGVNNFQDTVLSVVATLNGTDSSYNSAVFLAGDSSTASWASSAAVPVQAGQTAQFGCAISTSSNPIKCTVTYVCF